MSVILLLLLPLSLLLRYAASATITHAHPAPDLTLQSKAVVASDRCSPGSFWNGRKCTLCPPGTYQSSGGQKECTRCPQGSYSTAVGATFSFVCLRCPVNTVSQREGSTKCRPCPPGFLSTHLQTCVRCRAGMYFGGDQCYYCESRTVSTKVNSETCADCPFGYGPNASSSKCVEKHCPDGKQYVSSMDYCYECGSDTYRVGRHMKQCEKCPIRSVSNRKKTGCVQCPPGTRLINGIESKYNDPPWCQKCPKNSTTNGFSKPRCRNLVNGKPQPCPPRYFVDADGDCQLCAQNEYRDVIRNQCVACKKNEWSQGLKVTKCNKCAHGQLPTRTHWSDFTTPCECPYGHILSTRNGVTKCIKCPAGTYKAKSNYCKPCDRHLGEVSGPASEYCSQCGHGKTPSANGRFCVDKNYTNPCGQGFILPSLSSAYLYNTAPDICISTVTGCPKGQINMFEKNKERPPLCARNGKIVCPKRTLFNGYELCIDKCWPGEFLVEKKVKRKDGRTITTRVCKSCKWNEVSSGGFVKKCKQCPKGFTASGSECVCDYDKTINKKGECVWCKDERPLRAPKDCDGVTTLD